MAFMPELLSMRAHDKCDHCQRLRKVYWKAIVEVALLEERLTGSVGAECAPGPVQKLADRVEIAEQARKAARDALICHRIARDHSWVQTAQ
jgi:hypothetical protein